MNIKPRQYKYLSNRERKALGLLVSRLKSTLGDNIIMIKFFGSKLRGDHSQDSDIDVFLVIKERNVEISDKIAEIHFNVDLEYNTNISLIILSEHEFNINKNFDTPFIENVLTEGISL